MTITYALMEKLEEICKSHPHRARLLTKADVKEIFLAPDGKTVGGVKFLKDGQMHTEYGTVVIATGGYGADFTDGSLLQQHRPDLLHLPTTNGDHCTGDGIKMAQKIGAQLKDMTAVQVHPTGLVHPDEPNAKVLFLAAEALRGVGGVLLDREGHRFCNELGRRDYVTGEMWKRNKGPYRLILNGAASREIEWHCKHYVGRGLMKKFNSGTEVRFRAVSQSRVDYFSLLLLLLHSWRRRWALMSRCLTKPLSSTMRLQGSRMILLARSISTTYPWK